MKLDQIRDLPDLCVSEKYEYDITGIAYAANARKTEIAIAENVSELKKTKADIVLLRPQFVKTDKTLIYAVESLEYAAVTLAKYFVQLGERRDYSRNVEYQFNGKYYYASDLRVGEETTIGQNVVIGQDVVIGKRCVICPGAHINSGTRMGDNVYIGNDTIVSADSYYRYYDDDHLNIFHGIGRTVLEEGVSVGACSVIQRGAFSDTRIGKYSGIDDMVKIGHDVIIGENCVIVSQAGIAGNAHIGDRTVIYGQAGVRNNVNIGQDVVVYGKTAVTKNVPDGKKISGPYAWNHKKELQLRAKISKL